MEYFYKWGKNINFNKLDYHGSDVNLVIFGYINSI